MNKGFDAGLDLARAITAGAPQGKTHVVLGTPFIHLQAVSGIIASHPNVFLSAQNCSSESSGAYTGETSVEMLSSIGTEYVIIGHSERRQLVGESNETLRRKTELALAAGLTPIFCCGESLDIRQAGNHVEFVSNQLRESLFQFDKASFGKIVIAYEPIWAIGTGVTASPEQAQEMHQAIRALLGDQYDDEAANACTILYGGSVKPANADALFAQPDVDGGLVGGASLKPETFLPIIEAMEKTLA